jgi:hypothetical protein
MAPVMVRVAGGGGGGGGAGDVAGAGEGVVDGPEVSARAAGAAASLDGSRWGWRT